MAERRFCDRRDLKMRYARRRIRHERHGIRHDLIPRGHGLILQKLAS